MDNVADSTPPGWLEILGKSEAELATEKLVPAEEVHRKLRESIARLETKTESKQSQQIGPP